MAKKDKKSKESKKARAAEKQKKNQSKSENKSKKLAKKFGAEDEDDQDIDQILSQFAKDQEDFEKIKVEVCAKPSKRINPALISNPTLGKRELILFGGESSVQGRAKFHNELHTFNVENETWRKYTSKNAPLPRSSHAMCGHPSGIIILFGGEFSSPKQSTFYHYGDTWILDAETKEWSKVEQKNGPSSRSGHRICCWKNYFILHGGFRDLGSSTTYLNDMWLFDVTSYKWTQVEFPTSHSIPEARSGHSLLPTADGAIIYGGYCKVKAKKGLQKGKVLNDCWALKMKSDPSAIRFERRRKVGFTPSPRVGCSLVYHKNRGIMFGGVYDFEESEEQLQSEFFNNLFSYQVETNRWYNLSIRPKRKQRVEKVKEKNREEDLEAILNSILQKAKLEDDDEDDENKGALSDNGTLKLDESLDEIEEKEETYMNQLPHSRFNATTCVLDDKFYIYGGIFERGDQEFNLDSFYSIDLGKLDGVRVHWEDLSELEQEVEGSDDDEDDEEDDFSEEDSVESEEDEDEDTQLFEEDQASEEEEEIPDPRPWLPHPKPFESLRAFYTRTGPQFLEWAISSNRDARGKHLKKAAFDLCEERFWERRDQVSIAEDNMQELGGVDEVIEYDVSKTSKRR